jgi:hypothetical protein
VAKPEDKKQYNFTDPQSRIMKASDGFVQGYNCQIAVEENFQLIVGQAVTQKANDKEQLEPMVEAIEEQAGQKPGEILADSGYCSEDNFKYLARRHIDGYVATGRQKHGYDGTACKARAFAVGSQCGRADEAQASDPGWAKDLRDAQGDCGAGIRADQAGARISAISVARG